MSTVVEDRVAERCLHRLRHCEEPKQVSSGQISFDHFVFVLDRYTPLVAKLLGFVTDSLP